MRHSEVESHGLRSHFKRLVFPKGEAPRMIRGGLLQGVMMQLDFAHHTQRWLGLYERELDSHFRRLSEGIHTAIDVGASDGMYTLYFLAKTSAQKVLVFEPDARNLQLLKGNLELNNLARADRLEIVPARVGASVESGTITLDSFSHSIVPPCLIKVDIDGGEVDLLRGARTLLHLPEMRWIIEVHSKTLEQSCLQMFREAEYRTEVIPNTWWRHFLPELRPGELNRWLLACRETGGG